MREFEKLLEVADRLLGPEGCPWDWEQTLFTLQPYLLEEAHELLEAIDLEDPTKMAEELGDVFYVLLFIAKVGEKEGKFKLKESLDVVAQKLIRRHPHVFDKTKISSTEDIVRNWETIKKQEGKKHPLDGIPESLPSLAKAQKIIHKLKLHPPKGECQIKNSEELGERLWALVQEADRLGIDAESALRKTCLKKKPESSCGMRQAP